MLNKAKIAAINFHPAPPEYPGSGCINFALYDECDTYGVTAHLMNEKIDNGKILEVREFPVHRSENLSSVLERTHNELLHLCLDFISNLAEKGASFITEKTQQSEKYAWRGKARQMKEFDALKLVDVNIGKEELERVIKATNIEGYPPKIVLHGYEFRLHLNDD